MSKWWRLFPRPLTVLWFLYFIMKCLRLILRSISSEKYGSGGSLWLVLFHGISCRGQAEKEFKVEVEAIGRVRHKNLVRLLGYCAEGAHRYFVSCKLVFLSLLWNLDTAFARKINQDSNKTIYMSQIVAWGD